MARKGTLTVRIVGDAAPLQKTMNKTAGGMKKFAKVAAAAGALAAGAAVVVGKKLIEAGERASTSNARIGQIAESMGIFGDRVGAVRDRLVKLAEATARNTGVDQNAIKETQAKLLTFKELAESADEVGGAFDRATAAAVDLEAAGFGSAAENATQLGKALNDPIKGLTALNRSGITFTKTERERIEAMVEAGEVAEAQGVILEAIENQVGGTAAATANASDKMKVAWSQVQERLGEKLLPIFNKVSDWVVKVGLPAFEKFAERAGAVIKKWWPVVVDAFETVRAVVDDVVRFVSGIFDRFRGDLDGNSSKISEWAGKAREIFAQVREFIASVFEAIRAIFVTYIAIVSALWDTFGQDIVTRIKRAVGSVLNIVSGLFQFLTGIFDLIKAVLTGDWKAAWEAIKKIVSGAWKVIAAAIGALWDTIRFLFSAGVKVIKEVWKFLWDQLKKLLKSAWDNMVSTVRGKISDLGDIIGGIVDFIRGLPSKIKSAASGMWDGIVDAFKGAVNTIITAWNNLKLTIGGQKVDLPFGMGFSIPSITLNTPNIPRLDQGGEVLRSGLAMVHRGERWSGVDNQFPIGADGALLREIRDLLRRLEPVSGTGLLQVVRQAERSLA